MRRNDENIDKVEKGLRVAWGAQKVPEVSPAWRSGVMDEILSLDERPVADLDHFEMQGKLIWRFAAAAAAVAVMFTIYMLGSDLTGLSDLAMMMLEDPAGFMISSPFV